MAHGTEHAFNPSKVCYFCGISKLLALMTKGDCPRRVGVHADSLPGGDTPEDEQELQETADIFEAAFGTPEGLRKAWLARLGESRVPKPYVRVEYPDEDEVELPIHPCV